VTTVRLVRHGEPSEGLGIDPDLTARGAEQAAALVSLLEPCSLVTSPLQRARSTARPLELAWGVDALIEPAVRELPSPSSSNIDRASWLRSAMRGTFADLDPEHREWRDGIVDFIRSQTADTVIVTHAVVINALVGSCIGDDRVWQVFPAHTSVTTVEVDATRAMRVVELGAQATSRVV
jgi:broad specificity phosphatase PhoE